MRDENTKGEMTYAIGGISRRLWGALLCSVHLENSKAIYLTCCAVLITDMRRI